MDISAILLILIIHWIADFVLQTEWQAINKNSNNKALLAHTASYSLVWLFVIFLFDICNKVSGDLIIIPIGDIIVSAFYFSLITFVTHTITDYFTSRLNTYLFKVKNDKHNFFVSIGFDQILHYVQLGATYMLIY